jgi:hypothetical protein
MTVPGGLQNPDTAGSNVFQGIPRSMAAWCRELPEPAPGLAAETEADAAARRTADAAARRTADAAARRTAELRAADHALELAAAGQHWMFTPRQELTLVHAVQQPLNAPVLDLTLVATSRAPGATAEHLVGVIALDENSTGRVDLVAEWTEVTDAGPTGRDTRQMAVPVFGLLTAQVNREGVPGVEPAVLQNGILTFNTQAAEQAFLFDEPLRDAPEQAGQPQVEAGLGRGEALLDHVVLASASDAGSKHRNVGHTSPPAPTSVQPRSA